MVFFSEPGNDSRGLRVYFVHQRDLLTQFRRIVLVDTDCIRPNIRRSGKLLVSCPLNAEGILSAAGWPDDTKTVLVIGHQPTLGQIASLLLSGAKLDWHIKKANVWWFEQRERNGAPANYLRALMQPSLVPDGEKSERKKAR